MKVKQLSLLVIIALAVACQSHEYYDKLEEELASGVQNDSIFFDINFGMTEKDFFAQCWKLNKEGVLTHGAKNRTVKYDLKNELKAEATMNFYPRFHQGKIYKMPTTFVYNGWAPWNDHLSADSLLVDVVDLYTKWFEGEEFIKIESEKKGKAYVMIDGNRQISIYKKSVSDVEVMYTDLLVEKELAKK